MTPEEGPAPEGPADGGVSGDKEMVSGSTRSQLPVMMVIAGAVALSLGMATGVAHQGDKNGLSQSSSPPARVAPFLDMPRDGELVTSRILSSGDIRVDHWIRTRRPVVQVTVKPPLTQQTPGGQDPFAQRVEIDTKRGAQPGPRTVETTARTYFFASTHAVHVSYVITGALIRSGTRSHRALAPLTFLNLNYAGQEPDKTVLVRGARVLSVACTTTPYTEPQPCGEVKGNAWRVHLRTDGPDEQVMAQLDLV